MSKYHNDATPHITQMTLRVASIENSSHFYQGLLGLEILEKADDYIILRNKQKPILTLMKASRSKRFSEGLYHVAFLLPSLEALAGWFLYQQNRGLLIQGASNHLVSKAFYLTDPDGNGIEVYADTDDSTWNSTDEGIQMDTLPLDIKGLVNGIILPKVLPNDVKIGHIHLKSRNVLASREFYRLLGLSIALDMGHATFMSFHQYHHHIAINQWNKHSMEVYRDNDIDINDFTIQYESREVLQDILKHLANNKIEILDDIDSVYVYDPIGIKIQLTSFNFIQ